MCRLYSTKMIRLLTAIVLAIMATPAVSVQHAGIDDFPLIPQIKRFKVPSFETFLAKAKQDLITARTAHTIDSWKDHQWGH